MKKIRIWDLPTRVFHWALAACFVGLFVTGKTGGDAMTWHFRFGYAMGSLLLFRVTWGWIGGHWSRFMSFAPTPRTLLAHLRGDAPVDPAVGHTPLGAWAILAMLAVLLAQVGTGLFSEDKGETFGPLSGLVSAAAVRFATGYHKGAGQAMLLILVLLHLTAISFYLVFRKKNLIKPMITGDKWLDSHVTASRDDRWSRLAAAAILGGCAGIMAWVASFGT